jgi:hypothetical protein
MSRTVIIWPGSGQPVALRKVLLVSPSLRPSFLAAADPFREHDASIVARLNDDAAQEVLDAHPVADMHEHLRALHAPSLLADRQRVIELQLAMLELVEHHVERHQLAHRSGRDRFVRRLLEHHGAGFVIEQDGVPGRGLDRGRAHRSDDQESDESERRDSRAQQRCLHAVLVSSLLRRRRRREAR